MRHSLLMVVVAIAVAGVACSGSNSTSTVTAPAAPTMTGTFAGTVPFTNYVQPLGVDFKPFTIAQTGAVSVTLTAAGPPATIWMGLGLGTPSASTCSILSGDTTFAQAGATAQLTFTSVAAGSYCVQVYDVGNATAPIAYSVTVAHS